MAHPVAMRSAIPIGLHRVLHIGRPDDALAIRVTLAALTGDRIEVESVGLLAEGLGRLAACRMSAILLDLQQDAAGIEGLQTLRLAAPGVPVIVIGADEDETTARRAFQAGAHDYLLKSRLDSYWWPRLLRHTIARTRSEGELSVAARRLEVTLDSIGDALFSTNQSGRVTYLNRSAEAMTGWSRAEATGRPLDEVLKMIDSVTREPANPRELSLSTLHAAPFVRSRLLIRRDGSESAVEHVAAPTQDHLGHVTGEVIVLRDVSEAHALSVRMSHLASHDPLTDLPNRLLLADRLTHALELARRHQRRLAILYLDLDRFKHTNDSLGHLFGDELLRTVARELTTCVRSSDTVSRIGGDEFVVVLTELERVEDAAVGAQKIVRTLGRPRQLSGHDLRITVSVGVSVYPDDGQDTEGLLRSADLALYQAKDQGRNSYQFFERSLNVRAVQRREVETGLHRALDRHEFELHYQPKVNLKTGAVAGAEALLRWRHPERGLVHPAAFVPVAEDCGLITSIGRWVVYEACRQAQAWQDAGLGPVPVSVNISAAEFRSSTFLKHILGILNETGLDPRQLEIEVTEGVLMAHVDATRSILEALKAMGVRLAIDDFGSGWSSLSYLRRLPIDTLKIASSFLEEITERSPSAPIVSAIIGMGRSLRHRVIAEGVETEAQLAFLRAERCDEGQGYYFSRPIAAQAFKRALEVRAPLSRGAAPPTTE